MDIVQNIRAAIVFALIGIVVFVGAFVLIDRMTPYALWKEIVVARDEVRRSPLAGKRPRVSGTVGGRTG